MKPESLAILNELLAHHRLTCVPIGNSFPAVANCTITYGNLCQRAGVPHLTQSPGIFLAEIAEWCVQRGYPPINALAVNKDTQMPGDHYDLAQGCNILNWPAEVDTCIRFRNYP